LEGVKPPYGEKISSEGLSIAKEFLSNLMKMIHPIMPFISEEIYQGINPGSDCITASYPKMEQGSSDDLDVPLSLITEVRNLRVQQQLSPKQSLKVEIKNPSKEILHYSSMIGKLANIQIVDGFEVTSNLVMLPIQTMELWIELEKEINKEEEISKIDQELKHLTGFLTGVMKKLGNEKFMANAKPDVIEREQKKKEDAETKIKNLEQQKQVLLNK
jgi:valyl-tRNA synthetase